MAPNDPVNASSLALSLTTGGASPVISLSLPTKGAIGFQGQALGSTVNGSNPWMSYDGTQLLIGAANITTNSGGTGSLGTSSIPWNNLFLNGTIGKYAGITTAASGVIFDVNSPGVTLGATTAFATFGSFTTPNDGNKHAYLVTAFVKVTAFTSGSMNVQVSYTDEGAAAQTSTLNFERDGTAGFNSAINTVDVWHGAPMIILCNPNTTVTTKTTGAFTLTYDIYMTVHQVL